ncbi:MAG: transketolase [Candidatus Omnitrophica bacterium]|nr:transketolase [Candidatus Omnitrophota bacterium]
MDERSRYLRKLILQGWEGARKGHIGSVLSLVEILRVLYDDIMNYRPQEPLWPDRDRFILSKAHGCLALYAILADKGFIGIDELKTYSLDGSRLVAACEYNTVPGVEVTTGALGHGLPIGVGMALAARIQKRPSRVYVVMGDGELNEGSVWEAALYSAHHKLSNLTAIIDYNKLQIAGPNEEIIGLEPLKEKWASFGFAVEEIDGHDVDTLKKTLKRLPFSKGKPSVVICHTIKGKGIDFVENDYKWHWKNSLDDETVSRMKSLLEEE